MDQIDAAKQIARILRDLEQSTGSVVRDIEVFDIEITRFESEAKELERRVFIELERLPGTHWGQAES